MNNHVTSICPKKRFWSTFKLFEMDHNRISKTLKSRDHLMFEIWLSVLNEPIVGGSKANWIILKWTKNNIYASNFWSSKVVERSQVRDVHVVAILIHLLSKINDYVIEINGYVIEWHFDPLSNSTIVSNDARFCFG